MEKIKVIQFIGSMSDGGAETLVKDYMLMLDKNQFDVTLLVLGSTPETANWQIVKKNNVKIITVYPWWFWKKGFVFGRVINRLFGKWSIPFFLKRIFAKEKPEVIHVHLGLLRYICPLSKYLQGVKLFYTCHNLPKFFLGEVRPDENKAAKILIHNNNMRLIALHNDMAKEINELLGVNNTVVLKNGIDFSRFHDKTISKEDERKKLKIPLQAFVLGHVGRFEKQKNHNFLVAIFSEVLKQNKNAYLLMVGVGHERSNIVAKLNSLGLSGKYQILSHRTDVNEIMRAMDVFVFPSNYEGLGIVAIEAQVSGLRCVMSDQVPKDAFLTEKAVCLPLGNAKQWADVILDSNIKGQAYGNLDDWDMNKEIKKLEALYRGEV